MAQPRLSSRSQKLVNTFVLQCIFNHYLQTSAELNSERPELASSSISQISPEPTRELVSPSKPLPSGLSFKKKKKGSKPPHADGPATTSKSFPKVGQHFC